MRIAVVGAGVSGLVAAHLLSREHEVSVFESDSRVGGHTHTHDVAIRSRAYRVDTGFIVFNRHNYPLFSKLLDRLSVPVQVSEMSFSLRDDRDGLEYKAHTLNSLFCQRRNLVRPKFLRMIRDIRRFYKQAPRLLQEENPDLLTGNYLRDQRYSRAFIEQHLIPMASALWSAPPQQILEFPISYMVRFFANHQMLQFRARPQWLTVAGGSSSYLAPLCAPFRDSIHLRQKIVAISRHAVGARFHFADGQQAEFDRLVLACHSDQSLALLADPSEKERRILGAIQYQKNNVTLHTDRQLLPRNERAWAAWNASIPKGSQDTCQVTYCMNILQNLSGPEPLCVSLNAGSQIRSEKVIEQMTYHHPIYTPEALASQQLKGEIDGVNNTYYCGAYWGFGFHEDGVRSAADVAAQFNIPF